MEFNIKTFSAIIVSILALSIAYYFVIALPQYNQSKIDLQKQEFNAEQREKAKIEQEEKTRKLLLNMCLTEARETYWSYVKLNGEDLGDGTYNASQWVWNEAAKRQKTAEETCQLKHSK